MHPLRTLRGRGLMKRFIQTGVRRRRNARALIFRGDDPGKIDRMIDYFGAELALASVSGTATVRGRDAR